MLRQPRGWKGWIGYAAVAIVIGAFLVTTTFWGWVLLSVAILVVVYVITFFVLGAHKRFEAKVSGRNW